MAKQKKVKKKNFRESIDSVAENMLSRSKFEKRGKKKMKYRDMKEC